MSSKKKTNGDHENLPAVIAPPSLLAVAQPEAEDFGAMIEGQPRAAVIGIPIARIDHADHVFLVNGSPEPRIEGYPVFWFQARAWWKDGYRPGANNPPDCWSADMTEPSKGCDKPQSKTCAACAMSKFGSAPVGRGQACKVNTFLFLVNPAFGSPPVLCLILPPSSIRALMGTGRSPGYLQRAKHFKDANGHAAKYYEVVWARFALEKGGDRHDVLLPEPLFVCPNADEKRALAALRGKFMQGMEAMRGEVPVMAGGEDGEGDGEAN